MECKWTFESVSRYLLRMHYVLRIERLDEDFKKGNQWSLPSIMRSSFCGTSRIYIKFKDDPQ